MNESNLVVTVIKLFKKLFFFYLIRIFVGKTFVQKERFVFQRHNKNSAIDSKIFVQIKLFFLKMLVLIGF
jgi:hypothetical protein